MATFSTNITSSKSASFALPSIRSLVKMISKMNSVRRQRRELAELDMDQLEDLGIRREDAIAESRRFSWDVPFHWRA